MPSILLYPLVILFVYIPYIGCGIISTERDFFLWDYLKPKVHICPRVFCEPQFEILDKSQCLD